MTCSQCDQNINGVKDRAAGFAVLDEHRAACGRQCAGGKGTRKKRHRANACSRCQYLAHKETCTKSAPEFCSECNRLGAGARP
jgi:hypothetical protein